MVATLSIMEPQVHIHGIYARVLAAVVSVGLLGSPAQASSVTSPPPPEVRFVPHPNAFYLARHPTAPLLYLGCYYANEHKNLCTFPLGADGTVNTNEMRAFNLFTRDGTNVFERHSVQRPIVLPEERVLLLAAIPSAPDYFTTDTNNAEIIAVSLDEAGQPGKVLHGLRTVHGEKEVRGWQYDPETRRLYIGYHSYFGWIPIGANGVPASDEFRLVHSVMTIWGWVHVPEWKRFFARVTNGGLTVFALGGDGRSTEMSQVAFPEHAGATFIEVSPAQRKLYFLSQNAPQPSLVVVNLGADGSLTGLPRLFALGDSVGFRIDPRTNRLYAWNAGAILRVYALDARGLPAKEPLLANLKCGLIRDVLLDSQAGRVYVACTSPPEP